MSIKRRALLLQSLATAALGLTGCAPAQVLSTKRPFVYPSLYSIASDLVENKGFDSLVVTEWISTILAYRVNARRQATGEDNNLQIPLQLADEMLKITDDVLNQPWDIKLGALNILSLGNIKHLFVTIKPRGFDTEIMRMDGVSASILPRPNDAFDISIQPLSVGKDSYLLGILSNPMLPPVSDNEEHPDPQVTVFSGSYKEALDFLSRAGLFMLEANAEGIHYSLFGPNSNSFAHSLLRHGLGNNFDETKITHIIEEQGWHVPGFSTLLLPDRHFSSRVIGETTSGLFDDPADASLLLINHDEQERATQLVTRGILMMPKIFEDIRSHILHEATPKEPEETKVSRAHTSTLSKR